MIFSKPNQILLSCFIVTFISYMIVISSYISPVNTIFFVLSIFIIVYEVIRKKKGWDFLSLINITFFWLYCAIPLFMFNFPEMLPFFISFNENNYLKATPVILIAFICIIVGYGLSKRIKINVYVKEIENKKIILYILLPVTLIGTLSLYIYASLYGGIINLLENADLIRSQWIMSSSGLVFFRQPSALLSFSTWIIFSIMIYSKKRNLLIYIFSTIIFLLGLIQALSTAGRSQVLFLLLPIFIGYYKWKNNRVPLVVMLLLIGLIFTFIIYGDIIFMSFRNETGELGNNIDYIWSFLKEFIHPIGSLMMWMNKVENGSGFGYFRDIYLSILSFLPEKALGITLPNTVSYYNTYELTGIAKAVIPPGLIGFFYYSLGLFGVVIGSIAFGLVFGVLNHIFLKLNNKHPIFSILYVAYAISIVGLMMGGDLEVYMNLNFWNLFTGFFLCLLISKR